MSSKPSVNPGAISRVYAVVFALTAFVVAILAGLYAQNGAAHVLATALVCMVFCYMVGSLIGAVAERTIREHLSGIQEQRPIPEASPAIVVEQASTQG